MSLFKLVLPILGLLSVLNSYSQTYMLTGEIKNCHSGYVLLYKYDFNEKERIDSLPLSGESLSYDISKLETGMYNLFSNNVSIDFIVNKENVDIFFDCNNIDVIIYNKSVENNILNEYFLFYEDNNIAYNLLNQLSGYYPKSEPFYDEIVKKSQYLFQKNQNYIDSISDFYPKSFAAEILKLYRYNGSEFLDSNLIYSTNLKNTSFLGDLIFSYLKTFQKPEYTQIQQEKAFEPAIDEVFNALQSNPKLCVYVSDFLIDKFRYFDFDLISEYVALKTIRFTDSCIDDKELEVKLENIEALLKVRLGETAPNFTISKKKNLYDIKSEYKLIVFWATWCQHCDEFMNELINKNDNLLDGTKIVTYSLDFDDDEWKEGTKNFPKNWINRSMSQDPDESIPDSYAVYATPTIFLLDENNVIVAKPRKLQEIEGLIY